jgi:hypothetical protein
MSIAYTHEGNEDHPVATIYTGEAHAPGAREWSIEQSRMVPESRKRVSVAMNDLIGSQYSGPIYKEAGIGPGLPPSFRSIAALCLWVIASGGKVIISKTRS